MAAPARQQRKSPLGTTLALKRALYAHYPGTRAETIDAALGALEQDSRPLQQALTARLFHALAHLATGADEVTAVAALGQSSDYSLLLELLTAPAVIEQVRPQDPLGPARLRWLRDRERLLAADGGTVAIAATMEILGLKSRQAVQQRRARGTLLGLPLGGSSYLYPVWQFDGHAVIRGLPATLAALNRLDAWGQAAYLLAGEPRLNGLRPLDALRAGRIAEVVQAATLYGEQSGG